MGRSKAQISADAKTSSLEGTNAPSRDPSDPRHSRSTAGALALEKQVDLGQFVVRDKKLRVRIKQNPRKLTVQIPFVDSEATTTQAVYLNVGYLAGPALQSDASSDFALFRWTLPDDLEPNQPVAISIRWVEHGNDGSPSAYQLDVVVYAYKLGESVVGASTVASKSFSGTVNGTEGFENGGDLTIFQGALVGAKALWLKIDWGTEPGATDFVFSHVTATYSTRYYHTHER